MPPGYRVVWTPSNTESGVIAARLGGFVAAVKSWLIPPYEIPIIPTSPLAAHGWRAMVSTTS
jgi:hypothetical protein